MGKSVTALLVILRVIGYNIAYFNNLKEEEMSLNMVCSNADKYFKRISQDKSNSQIMWDTVGIEKLGKDVVARLEVIANREIEHWWDDKELISIFDLLYTSGIILLPLDVVQRVRWIALVCEGVSSKEGYSCGNVIVPVDYLPEEEIYTWSIYSEQFLEQVMIFRRKVAKHGWKSLLA